MGQFYFHADAIVSDCSRILCRYGQVLPRMICVGIASNYSDDLRRPKKATEVAAFSMEESKSE